MISIDYLKNVPRHHELLSSWFFNSWSFLWPGSTQKDWDDKLRERMNHSKVPTVFIALEGDIPVGSASIFEHDMDTQKHLTPWLGAVYVHHDHRRKGIGSALVKRVTEEIKLLSFPEYYLFTRDMKEFYETLGWEKYDEVEYKGHASTIMKMVVVQN